MAACVAVFGVAVLSIAWTTSGASSPRVRDTLGVRQSLQGGHELVSDNGQYRLALLGSGALVLYDANNDQLWSNDVSRRAGHHVLTLEGDGDLVEQLQSGGAEWSSRTRAHGSSSLVVEDDGNVVLQGPDGPLWSTRTATSSRYPEGIGRVDGASQLIIVTSTRATASTAWLTTFEFTRGRWIRQFGTMAALVGLHGWIASSRRREGDDTTPEGIFSLGSTIYGNDADPGVSLAYHRLVPGDYWDENPATGRRYNTFVHSRDTDCAANPFGGDTECLWLEASPYPYLAVVDFNTPSRGAYGSGIFLHATTGPTEGCVSVRRADLVKILRWLRRTGRPRIVLAGNLPLRSL